MIRLAAMIAVLLVLPLCSHAQDEPTNDWLTHDRPAHNGPTHDLEQGIQSYQAALDTTDRNHRVQLFSRAEAAFAQVIEQQAPAQSPSSVSAELYLNWGNAALGAEHLGAAILAYRRALATSPHNARARQNLQHARSMLPDWIPRPDDQVSYGSFFDWAKHLDRGEWLGLAAIAFLCALILLALFIRTGNVAARNVAIIIGCLWLAMLWRGMFADSDTTTPVAVVIAEETLVRSADSINAPPRFPQPLTSGTEVKVITDRDDWLRVQLFDGREGWLPASTVKR